MVFWAMGIDLTDDGAGDWDGLEREGELGRGMGVGPEVGGGQLGAWGERQRREGGREPAEWL